MTKRKSLINKADKVFNKFIRERDLQCVICGSKDGVSAGHLITSKRIGIRYNPLNCHAQCRGCNMKHQWFPEIYFMWFLNKFNIRKFKSLVEQSIQPFNDDQIKEVIEQYGTN